jgi:hypothetical protein
MLVYWGLVSLPLWGKVRYPSASSLLSACYVGLLTVFQLCNVVWLWMLLTVLGDELCGMLSALFQWAMAYHPPTVGPSDFSVFVYWKFAWRSTSCPSPLLWCTQSTPSPLCCVFLFRSLFIIQFVCLFVCFAGWGSVCPGGYAGLSQGQLQEYCILLICSPVGLHLPSRFGAGIRCCRCPTVFSV